MLTVGFQTHSSDVRISVLHVEPNDWKLNIKNLTHRDAGTYKCQLSDQPTHVKIVNLKIVGKCFKIR